MVELMVLGKLVGDREGGLVGSGFLRVFFVEWEFWVWGLDGLGC